ncbi:MAG: orotate phosphoribosyltransferase [Elusimicrobia bacterium]|nr:orotate phosphoribosyltransferase [Elusimicrobiota bacterium]
MKKMDMLGLLQEHGAVVSGHFQLASGLHSPIYIQTALVLQYPHVARRIALALTAKFPQPVDVVVSPSMSSVVLGQEVARIKKCRAIFMERNQGVMALKRDFKLERGERALVVMDVLMLGHLTAEVAALTAAYGAKVVGVGTIVDRSTERLSLCVPVRSLISYPLQVSPPDSCPQCLAGIALIDATKKNVGAQEGE